MAALFTYLHVPRETLCHWLVAAQGGVTDGGQRGAVGRWPPKRPPEGPFRILPIPLTVVCLFGPGLQFLLLFPLLLPLPGICKGYVTLQRVI